MSTTAPVPATAATSDVAAAPAAAASAPVRAPAEPRAETVRQPIPYRDEGGGLAADAGGAVFAAILLLALLVAALQFARKRGLLDRWIVAAPARAAGRPQMRVEQALRIGPKTMVYRIRDGERRYLLVESTAQASLTPIADAPTKDVSTKEIEDDVSQTFDAPTPDDATRDARMHDDAR